MAREIIEHAQQEYPKEACGLISGPPGEARALHRLTNVDPDPVMRYNADPRELKRVQDEIYERDWDIVSIYHSHTHSPAFPSPTDVDRAFYPEAVYLLASLADRSKPVLRAFRILDGQITELEIVEEEEANR
jgi:[CysO sulfur-carrier protein]-S-L-cysteine hydrolase